MKTFIEYTDTFSGEANYSWVERKELEIDEKSTDKQIKRLAKKAMGLNGISGKWNEFGDMLEFRPSGSCTVLFITFEN